jgi:hypothetical protein
MRWAARAPIRAATPAFSGSSAARVAAFSAWPKRPSKYALSASHLERGTDRLDQPEQHHEQAGQQQQEEIERQVDPVRRIEQHHVARIEAGGDGNPDGGCHQCHEPEK